MKEVKKVALVLGIGICSKKSDRKFSSPSLSNLNLFDWLPGERPEQHRSGLLDAFAMGTALVSPLDELLRHSLDRAYETPPVSVEVISFRFMSFLLYL